LAIEANWVQRAAQEILGAAIDERPADLDLRGDLGSLNRCSEFDDTAEWLPFLHVPSVAANAPSIIAADDADQEASGEVLHQLLHPAPRRRRQAVGGTDFVEEKLEVSCASCPACRGGGAVSGAVLGLHDQYRSRDPCAVGLAHHQHWQGSRC
jgi:hypothetical protein